MKKTKTKKMGGRQLKRLSDEVKVQTHLFEAEVQTRWKKLERDWSLIQSEARKIAPDAANVFSRSVRLAKPLILRIEKSLERIQAGIDRHHRKMMD